MARSSSTAIAGSKHKSYSNDAASMEFPVLAKQRSSPKKKDATKRVSTRQGVELPKVSAITYSPQVLDSGEELEILKCILVREGYLQRLLQASTHGQVSGSHLGETIDLLDLLRIATLEVVETIRAWRKKKHTQDPYKWNNLNYLLKIPSDLDFLQKHTGLIQWLGFTLERNPFILPANLDCRVQTAFNGSSSSNPARTSEERCYPTNGDNSDQYVEIGGKRRLEFGTECSDRPVSPGKAAAHAAALAERKRAKHPYETRILNDEELLPLNARNGERGVTPSLEKSRPKSRVGHTALVIPSQIGELDMSRIRDAESVIVQEEARFGRFTRDTQGHVVPEEEAQRRLNMVEMSGGAYTAQPKKPAKPLDEQEERQEGNMFPAVDDPSNVQLSSHPRSLPGKLHAKKKAGMLGPISKPTRKPTLQGPRKRSRGAQLEEALESEKQANAKFGILIDLVREEIERKEMDVAYFESIAGVQFYGDELREFSTKARKEIAQLRQELKEKEYIYAHKMVNIHKKEEIIHVFKEKQKSATEATRAAEIQKQKEQVDDKSMRAGDTYPAAAAEPSVDAVVVMDRQGVLASTPSNQEDAERARALAAPILHHLCATLIQKIARGMVTRAAFGNLKIEYYVSSKYIQAAVRGFLARRRVAKMYWSNAASVVLQRYTRGMIARRFVRARRQRLLVLQSAVKIQKVVRGHFGRIRMSEIRRLFRARSDIVDAGEELLVPDLKELADACFQMVSIPSMTFSGPPALEKPLTPLVLGLVRILMLFTCDCDADVDVPNVRWKEAASFLRCSVRLVRRMKKITVASEGRHLRTSELGNTLLDAYLADTQFQEETFRRLGRGWKGATTIFRWITSFSVITRLQRVLPARNAGYDGPFLISSAIDKREAAQDQVEDSENAIREEDIERRFVPADLVQVAGYPNHRPRPVVVVFAHDVPCDSKEAVVAKLMVALPGLFITMNRSTNETQKVHGSPDPTSSYSSLKNTPWTAREKTRTDWEGLNVADIRTAVSVGYNVILEGDIGLSDPPQRRFLGAFSALKAAIQPPPLCILVKGSLRNRPVCANEPEQEIGADSEKSDAKVHRDRPMADARIKRAFERAAEYLFALSRPHLTTQMTQLSAAESPAVPFIIVMEAIIILLTPAKRYEGPKPSTSSVSWKLGKRLLVNPSFFCRKLQEVKQQDIARDNLVALDRYLNHKDWPTKTLAHSMSSNGELLFALSSWVETIVECAHLIMDCQGLASEISRTTPIRGLFGSVVTFHNAGDGLEFDDRRSGEGASALELMDAILADVRVYRKCHALDGRRCIVNVYHDCLRIYFTAYDPTSSWRWQTIISESDVNNLLAPNSIERGNVKYPPKTQTEMYARLVQLCLLQAQKSQLPKPTTHIHTLAGKTPSSTSSSAAALPSERQLVVRPKAIRLYRRAINLSGYLTTITISELSRGRVQVDAFVHNSSHGKDMRSIFNLESILKRMSAQQARRAFVAPIEIPPLVLDRLHLFRTTQSLISLEKSASATGKFTSFVSRQKEMATHTLIDAKMDMKLSIRTREFCPGRLLMRKAVRSPWLTAVWVCSVFENHSTGDYRAEFYQPQTSESVSMHLSQWDCEDFVRRSKNSSHAAVQMMMKHFQFQTDPDTGSVIRCSTRRILARFPFGIPFVKNPHYAVTKREIVRAYIQVERREPADQSSAQSARVQHGARPTGQLQYRICLPDTCEEQTLILDDSEMESYFTKSSWIHASSIADRKRMSRELVRCFAWEPLHEDGDNSAGRGRVVAQLPSGRVEAYMSTRVTGKKKKQAPPKPPSRMKRSPFTARGSLDDVPVLSSCVQLLDSVVSGMDKSRFSQLEKPIKRCYTYESEEMVHKGSYRANGVLVIVQVFMKAVIIDTLVPQIPVDRVIQEDSFVMTFNFYHPRSSAATTALIRGRKDLREVVGPDKADLIKPATIHELIQHIVESRTEVLLKPTAKIVHSQSFRGHAPPSTSTDARDENSAFQMDIIFQRDRLYTKQKATPINESLRVDRATNASKLVDKAPERGLKVLTKARVISGHGRVILTVFDVGCTRQRGERGDSSSVAFRVDAYIHETSSRLSLLMDAADIAHIVGDDTTLLDNLSSSTGGNEGTDHDDDETRRQVAQLLTDHIGIESRHDGVSSDRLFITEYFMPKINDDRRQNEQTASTHSCTKRNLVFKTTRSVSHEQILVSVYVHEDCSLMVRCYEPRSSQRCDLHVGRDTLGLMLGIDEGGLAASVFASPTTPLLAVMTHICSFVRIEKREHLEGTTDVNTCDAVLVASLLFDELQARACRTRLAKHSGDGETSPGVVPEWSSTWNGMVVGKIRPSYFAVRLLLLRHSVEFSVARCEAVCSAFSPSAMIVATIRFSSSDLENSVRRSSLQQQSVSSAEDMLQHIRDHLRVELLASPAQAKAEEHFEANDLGVTLSIALS